MKTTTTTPQETATTPGAAATLRPNPYVGPRSYTARDPSEGRQLYGRDREVKELLQLLMAERIVLLFSPSGAGKSSLINAALLPALRGAGFRVLPVMRVAHEPPDAGLREVSGFNRYVLSALMSLEEALPERAQRDVRELAGTRLPEYLRKHGAEVAAAYGQEGDGPLTLIFDQFEEILTLDPTDIKAKREFFAQAGEALRDPQHWALFSMREDYAASLDPFVRLIPTAFATTYRLDLLGESAARSAIRKPAGDSGVKFASEAARALVNDLRTVNVQLLDGGTEKRLGPHVDPVHLQVVCYRLWEKLPVTSATETIGEDALAEGGGDVNGALAGYYADRVAAVTAKGYTREREIRGWIGKHLITEQGVRGQVLRGEGQTQGIDNRVIDELIGAHLLRREERRGASWIELAHDRLVEPVRADNAKYRKTLNQLQRQAEDWHARGRPEWMLLRGDDLTKANEWARLRADELTEVEKEFRKASNRVRARAVLFTVLGAICVVLLATSIFFWHRAYKAEEAARSTKDIFRAEVAAAYNVDEDVAGKLDDEGVKQIIAYNDEYQKVADVAPDGQRAQTQVMYFYKTGDPPEVAKAIRDLGFNVDLRPAQNPTPTNYVRYGAAVKVEDVRLVSLALLRSGVSLRVVDCFISTTLKTNVIEIGAWAGHNSNKPVDINAINSLGQCPGAATPTPGPSVQP